MTEGTSKSNIKKYQEFIEILTLILLKSSLYDAIYIDAKYIGHAGEERGSFSEPVSQYRYLNVPETDNNDITHKNDVNTLS